MSKERTQFITFYLLIVALGAVLRFKAAIELPVDFDEPVYVSAGADYAQAMRQGDLEAIVNYRYNSEHPILVKLLYGGSIWLSDTQADEFDAVTACRLVSVAFGIAAVALLAYINRFAGLALALHTTTTKYTSQAYLEALPAFSSIVCIVAYSRSRGRDRWLALAAMGLGLAVAGKYIYGIAGIVVALALLWQARCGQRKWPDLLIFGLLASAVFVAFDPFLWANPLGRLLDSITFHSEYSHSAPVTHYNYGWWKPLHYLFRSFPVQWHGDVFIFEFDEPIFLIGLLGLLWLLWNSQLGARFIRPRFGSDAPTLSKSEMLSRKMLSAPSSGRFSGDNAPETPPRARKPTLGVREPGTVSKAFQESSKNQPGLLAPGLILGWFALGLLFLFIWPTKWPQYTLIITPPLCLAFGAIVGEIWRRMREERDYWGDLTYGLFPKEFWVALALLVVLLVGAYAWRGVIRRKQMRGWSLYDKHNSPLTTNVIQAIAIGQNGQVWLGTTRGLVLVDWPPDGAPTWSIYTPDNSALPDSDVTTLAVDAQGDVWLGSRQGLTRFDPVNDAWTHLNDLPAGGVRAITPAADGSVWLSTDIGAIHTSATGGYEILNTSNSGLVSDVVFDITLEQSQDETQIWFATNRGVSRFRPDDKSWISYTTQNSDLALDGVSGAGVDYNGGHWFPTLGKGVSQLDASGQWRNYNVANSDLPWNTVTLAAPGCHCEQRLPWLWFGADIPSGQGSKAAAYQPPDSPQDTGKWHIYSADNSGLPDSPLQAIAVQCTGGPANYTSGPAETCEGLRVWFATSTQGIAVYQLP